MIDLLVHTILYRITFYYRIILLLLENVDVKECSFVIIRYTMFLNLVYIHHTKKNK